MIVDRVSRKTGHPRRPAGVEPHLLGDGPLDKFPAPVLLSRRRGARRDVLLPGVDVAHQRLSRPRHAVARHGAAPDERLRRHDRRRLLCGASSASTTAGDSRSSSSAGSASCWASCSRARSSSRCAASASRRGRRAACPAAGGGALGFGAVRARLVGAHADAALPDGRVHVRELRRGGPAVVDAEVPLRHVSAWAWRWRAWRATVFVQLASMAGAPLGGWLADWLAAAARRAAASPSRCSASSPARRSSSLPADAVSRAPCSSWR